MHNLYYMACELRAGYALGTLHAERASMQMDGREDCRSDCIMEGMTDQSCMLELLALGVERSMCWFAVAEISKVFRRVRYQSDPQYHYLQLNRKSCEGAETSHL